MEVVRKAFPSDFIKQEKYSLKNIQLREMYEHYIKVVKMVSMNPNVIYFLNISRYPTNKFFLVLKFMNPKIGPQHVI